ncbi:MAG: hypothetical protein EYX74_04775 [Desulfobulbaceae bacterium]|nr:MAG: hypothetical protein EYX74_04775 [Desulfobulbaceae bacterium]
MSINNNPYELYKLLPKTNCGRCLLPSCLAFAAAVIRGHLRPDACPDLARETLLFAKRCEEPWRQLADEHGEDYFALLTMFGAQQVEPASKEREVDDARRIYTF